MFYQKCEKCDSEWNGKKELEECPFCNEKIKILPKLFVDIDEALSYIFSKYGFEIVEERRKFIGLISDHAPSLDTEIKLIQKALNSGIYSEILKSASPEGEVAIAVEKRAVSILTNNEFLDPVWAEKAVLFFTNQLRAKEHKISDSGNRLLNHRENSSTAAIPSSESTRAKDLIHRLNKLISVGNHIYFGKYYFDSKQKSDIEWEVIDKVGNKILLLSSYCITAKPYHVIKSLIPWKDSFLRSWLNGLFYEKAFTAEEKLAINETDLKSSINPYSGVSTGDETVDKLFILGYEDLLKYKFTLGEKLMAKATPYAKLHNVYCNESDSAFWWLRTPGNSRDTLMFVKPNGFIDKIGNYVNQPNKGIRPALWVDLDMLDTVINEKYKK